MNKSALSIIVSASLVFAGTSVAYAAPVDKAAVNACISLAKSAKDTADRAALDAYTSVASNTTETKAINKAKKAFHAKKKANLKVLGDAIKACKPAKKK